MTRRKDRYQPRAASASQPKTLKTSRDVAPGAVDLSQASATRAMRRDRHLVRGASTIGRDRLTTEERLSDIVEILAHGLLWLDVLRDYHGSIRSHNFRRFVTEGGLISFGIDQAALYRLAASYVDRILKGEKPADLPVQAPTKYETVLNIKTAKALGLEVPPSVFARAGEVIE